MLVDTNVLACLLSQHPRRDSVRRALKTLTARGIRLYVSPQNLIELWVLATRPKSQNGIGLSPEEAALDIDRIKSMFIVLDESAAVYPAWERLVRANSVSGKAVHDTRIVATMQVNQINQILTFDRGFSRYPDIEVIVPTDVEPV